MTTSSSSRPSQSQSSQNKNATAVSAIDISHALKGTDFPANCNDLVQQARNNNASQEVINVIKNLPQNEEFNNMADVERAFGEQKKAS